MGKKIDEIMYRNIESRQIPVEEIQRNLAFSKAVQTVSSLIRAENMPRAMFDAQGKDQINETWTQMTQDPDYGNKVKELRERMVVVEEAEKMKVVEGAEKKYLPDTRYSSKRYSSYKSPFLHIKDPDARKFLGFIATSRLISGQGEFEYYEDKYVEQAEIIVEEMGFDSESAEQIPQITLEAVVGSVLQGELEIAYKPKQKRPEWHWRNEQT